MLREELVAKGVKRLVKLVGGERRRRCASMQERRGDPERLSGILRPSRPRERPLDGGGRQPVRAHEAFLAEPEASGPAPDLAYLAVEQGAGRLAVIFVEGGEKDAPDRHV